MSNEMNLSNEQQRYDHILELAPAKETVSVANFLHYRHYIFKGIVIEWVGGWVSGSIGRSV